MSTARDYLAAVQQRAKSSGALADVAQLLVDVEQNTERLVAALTAALDVVDRIDAIDDELAHRPTIVRHLRAAITDALTPKEND